MLCEPLERCKGDLHRERTPRTRASRHDSRQVIFGPRTQGAATQPKHDHQIKNPRAPGKRSLRIRQCEFGGSGCLAWTRASRLRARRARPPVTFAPRGSRSSISTRSDGKQLHASSAYVKPSMAAARASVVSFCKDGPMAYKRPGSPCLR